LCFLIDAVACLGELGVFFGSILFNAVSSDCLVIVSLALLSGEEGGRRGRMFFGRHFKMSKLGIDNEDGGEECRA